MCDFSLELAKSRPARQDEELTVKRFNTGSQGVVDPSDLDCAVCLKVGDQITLHLETGDIAVVFAQRSSSFYRDGFTLPTGKFSLLQSLAEGTRMTVTRPLPVAIVEAADAREAFEPEIAVRDPVTEIVA